jgi:hypothetical protein
MHHHKNQYPMHIESTFFQSRFLALVIDDPFQVAVEIYAIDQTGQKQ